MSTPRRREEDQSIWSRHRSLAAYLFLAFVAVASLGREEQLRRETANNVKAEAAARLYRSALAACFQQDVARTAANDSAKSLRTFLQTAATGNLQRAKTQNAAQKRISMRNAAIFQSLADHQHVIPIVDCAKEVEKP